MTANDKKGTGKNVQVEVMGQQGGNNRLYRDVPDYQTADDETRAAMDALIATVDWDDLNTIIGFGSGAKDDVLAVSRKINAQSALDESFVHELREYAKKAGEMDLTTILERLDTLAKGGLNTVMNNKAEVATGVGLSLIAGPLVGLGAALGLKGARTLKEKFDGARRKASGEIDYEGEAEAVRNELRKAVINTRELVDNLQTASRKIPGYVDNVNEMGRARVKAYSNLSLAIGAGAEVIRRFKEDVLPAARESGTIGLEELAHMQMSGEAMERNLDGLIAARAVSMKSIATLTESQSMYVNMKIKIEEHLTTSVPEWEAQIAHGNMLVDQFDLQKIISAADKKSGDLAEQADKLHETSRIMHDKSMQQGTYDLQRIAQATEKMTLRLSHDIDAIATVRANNDAARQRLLEATEKLHDTFRDNAQRRADNLLAGPETAKPGFLLGDGRNDNVSKDEADKKSPAKKGSGPSGMG